MGLNQFRTCPRCSGRFFGGGDLCLSCVIGIDKEIAARREANRRADLRAIKQAKQHQQKQDQRNRLNKAAALKVDTQSSKAPRAADREILGQSSSSSKRFVPPTLKHRQPSPTDLEVCRICRRSFMRGHMEAHLRDMHHLNKYGESISDGHEQRPWISIFQGGLPGLGKRK